MQRRAGGIVTEQRHLDLVVARARQQGEVVVPRVGTGQALVGDARQECRLFLVDRTKAGTARWCSMATCGNRVKARRRYQRAAGH